MTRAVDTFLSMPPLSSHPLHAAQAPVAANSANSPNSASGAPYLDAAQFAAVVDQAAGLALVDFTAAWCPPCRVLGPQIDALARELAASVAIVKVDVDAQPDLAARFGVRSLPTLVFLRDGQVVDRHIGALPPERIRARLRELAPTPPAAVA